MENLFTESCVSQFQSILHTIKSTKQHERVFSHIIDALSHMYRARTCAIVIIDQKTEYLRVECSHGLSLTFEKEFRRKLATGSIGRLLWTGKPVVIGDYALELEHAEEVRLEHQFTSCACLQLACDGKTIGYLYVDSDIPNRFGAADLTILQTMADLAAIGYVKAQLQTEVLRLDNVDHETGFVKYISFLDDIRRHIDRAKETGERFGLILCDVDNYKTISHTYGEQSALDMLRGMADTARSMMRSIDSAGRYGFDEIILLRGNSGVSESMEFAHTLSDAITNARYTEKGIQTSVSTGVAVYPENGATCEDLLLTAKKALFEAQHTSRGAIFRFPGVWYERSENEKPFEVSHPES